MFQYSEAYINHLLTGIYNGTFNTDELPESLYYAISDYLKQALYKGFGGDLKTFEGTPDFDLLNELRTNIYMFSAAKTYQQVRDISSQLYDGDELRPRSEFLKIGHDLFDTWNDDWGKSEYNTAVASASMASKWNDIERNKDILPVLSYSTASNDACEICAPLDGLTLPVDAPEWDEIYPPNHFNCMCIVTQEEEGVALTPDEDNKADEVEGKMSDVFKMNSGKDKVIFSDDHPYFDIAPKDQAYAERNFDLPIPPISTEGNFKNIFTPAKTIKEAENWALNYELANKISYKGLKFVEVANEVNKVLFDAKLKTGITYDEINTINQKNSTVMLSYSSMVKPGGARAFNLEKSRLSINNHYFNKFENIDDVVASLKQSRKNEWTTSENVASIVWHEFGHRLTALNLKNGGSAAKFASPIFDYKRLGRYASTSISETLSEILAYYKKTGDVPENWEKLFNTWSEIKLKDL